MTHEFLLDSQVLKQSTNITREPVVAEKMASNPVLSPQPPWEGGLDRIGLPSLFVDEDEKLRMLYWTRKPSNLLGNICTAESLDGETWERTLLYKYPSGSGDPTQIIVDDGDLPGSYTQTTTLWVLENPRPDLLPNSKYLGLIEMRDPRNTFIVTSPNGIDWDLENRHMVTDEKNDTESSLVYGPDGKFHAYIRGWITHGDGTRERVVDMAESTDLQNWSERTRIMQGSVDHQVYGMQTKELDGVYVSLMSVFHTENQTLDNELVYSRDANTFEREFPLTPSLPHGEEGDWDYGMAYHNSGIIEWNGRWLVAYTGGENEHDSNPVTPLDIGMASFDRGRLICNAQSDPNSSAFIETLPLSTEGAGLLVNAELAEGILRVELVDENGNPVDGYGMDDCILSAYDDLRYRVTWNSNWELPESGQYGLRFELDQGASMYAYEFIVAPEPSSLVLGVIFLACAGWRKQPHRRK
ncbi:MAG: hypothetical protein JW849_10865 [Phycisphaerae bacterium]|nr:hypothetical protein [Phycisphaerae bacterium]